MTIVYNHHSQSQGFPVPNPTESYWQAKPHRLASYRSSDTVPEHADIVIIGTGLAGVATAYHILKACADVQEKPKVVLLEARQACSGATGRNGKSTVSQCRARNTFDMRLILGGCALTLR